jgi:CRP/FNR family cyclic AMP-dependent transcriptional regulator
MTDLDRLRQTPWLARQPATVADALLAAGRLHRLGAGQWAQGEGDPDPGLTAVIAGRLAVESSAGPERSVMIDLIHPGAWIGQAAPAGGGPRIVTLRALGPAELFVVPEAALRRLGQEQPAVWQAVSGLIYDQLQSAVRMVAFLLTATPLQRVAMRLALLAEGEPAEVAASHLQLAELTGLSRKGMAEQLAMLEAKGLVRRGYGRVAVLDREALLGIAAMERG